MHTNTLFSVTIDSPIRPLTIIANDRALVAITWGAESEHTSGAGSGEVVPIDAAPQAAGSEGARVVLERAVTQLQEYFRGDRREFDLPLEPDGTAFQLQAWEALRSIPYGETISYGEQATRLGDKNKSRAVGAANGRNPIPIVVPCHRVVGSNGHLTGFAGGLETKAWLLAHEFGVRAGS